MMQQFISGSIPLKYGRYSKCTQVVLVSFFACVLTEGVLAADWRYSSNTSAGLEYTDNLFFTSSDKLADTILLVRPALELIGESLENRTRLGAGVSFERYKNEKDADRNDPFANFDWEHYWERQTLGLGVDYRQASTRTSELETTGRVNIYGTRTDSRVTPRWQGILDDRNTLSLNMEIVDVSFDLPTFFDYQNYSLDIGWHHQWTPVQIISLNVIGQRYDSETLGLDYDYGAVMVGTSYQADEQFSYDFTLGGGYAARVSEVDYTTWLINARVTSDWEYDHLTLGLSSDLSPTSSGELRQIHALDLAYRREMSSSLNFTFTARLSESFPVDDADQVRNENLNVQPGIDYQLGEEWFLNAWYRYQSNQNVGINAVTSNTVYLGIRYQVDGDL